MEDYTIGLYIALLITTIIGVVVAIRTRHKGQTVSGYHTAHGSLSTWKVFFTMFATTFSAFTVIGLPAMFYAHGIGALWFMWIGILLTPFTVKFIGSRIVSLSIREGNRFSSPIGLLMGTYRSPTLTLLLSVITIAVLTPYLTLQIAGIGKFIVSVSNGDISYLIGALFCCIIVGVYMFTGGAAADAETDKYQGIIMLLGVIVVFIIILYATAWNFSDSVFILNQKGLLTTPGPKGYFTPEVLISYGLIFTLISISTPQVSQKLMGVKDLSSLRMLTSWYGYALIGSIVVFFAGIVGFYAASHLSVASPDFVTGDVLRHLSEGTDGIIKWVFFGVSVLFMSSIVSAAISTIDSLVISVSGIVTDVIRRENQGILKIKYKLPTFLLLVLGFLLAMRPPEFIVSLAQVQLSGLTSLVPCLLGPLFGVSNKVSGWLALLLGITPLLLSSLLQVQYFGFDPGFVGFLCGLAGLSLGQVIQTRIKL